MSIASDSSMGKKEIVEALGANLRYCRISKMAMMAPIAKSALRKPMVLVSDQIASRALLMKIIKALKIEKERFEPIGFI